VLFRFSDDCCGHFRIGVATKSSGFAGFDGIIGYANICLPGVYCLILNTSLGPTDLTLGTLSSNKTVPTVVDNLSGSGTIPSSLLGVFFQPTSELNNTTNTGELSFGSVDSSKITSRVTFTPITTQFPASAFWGIDTSITYGTSELLQQSAGLVDTGRF
jgi:pepsin A